MFFAMVVMMLLGMAVSIPIAFAFVGAFGAMEVMVPVMLTGMTSGMASGMWLASGDASPRETLLLGAAAGVATLVCVWLVNSRLSGPRPVDPPPTKQVDKAGG